MLPKGYKLREVGAESNNTWEWREHKGIMEKASAEKMGIEGKRDILTDRQGAQGAREVHLNKQRLRSGKFHLN